MKLLIPALYTILLAYVLPVDLVVLQIAKVHRAAPPLRVEATLEGIGDAWPERVTFELHPEFGFRIQTDRGDRWLFHADGGLEGTQLPAPPWIPDLRILTLRDAELLSSLVVATGVDTEFSEFARCGEFDCFVLGGRDATAQIWVEKDRFEVLEMKTARGWRTLYAEYRAWSKVRFPSEIRVFDKYGSVGSLRVESVARATLSGEHFSAEWVRSREEPQP